VNPEYVEEIRRTLINANGNIGDALVELQYAEDKGHLDDNIEEIMDMAGEAQVKLSQMLEDYIRSTEGE